MLGPAWGLVAAAVVAVTPGAQPAKARSRFNVVGRAVGEGAETPPFWREYQRISASGDRARYEAVKHSQDPYERALAVYLAPRFGEMAFVEAALSDTRFVSHAVGCMYGDETIGSLAYALIRGGREDDDVVPAAARYDKPRRIALARSILRSLSLVHLHGAAGVELGDLLDLDRNGEGCGAFFKLTAGQLGSLDAAQLGRLLTSIDLPWRERTGDRLLEFAPLLRGYVLACAIDRPDVSDEAKRSLIDFAYARAPHMEAGRRFHAAAGRATLAPALAAYDREQFDVFQKWKPLVDDLTANKTTDERRRRADIRKLFGADHPMVLADVLGFDGSELQDSAPLRRSKAEAVLRLVRACRDRGGIYAGDVLAETRLYVRGQAEHARSFGAPETKRMGFPARDYGELERLLGLKN